MSQQKPRDTQRNLTYYCDCLSQLNVISKRKLSQGYYKPILLLSIMDMITQGLIKINKIFASDELIENFNKYWNIIASKSSSNYNRGLCYSFFRLQSDGFWHLKFNPGFNGIQPKTTNQLKEAVEHASLDEELFELLQNETYSNKLIKALISTWFSANQKDLEEILRIHQKIQIKIQKTGNFIEKADPQNQPKFFLRKSLVRNAFFHKTLVHIYDYKCAFCR